MLNCYALSEFLYDNHTPCLHFSTPKQQTVLCILFMPLPRYIWTKIMLYMCISHLEDIVFAFTIKINFLMILRSIAILLMSPLNIIQQSYIYWNDLTVCIIFLHTLLLRILLLLVYNHCYDFAPCGTLIEIKISFFLPYTLNIYVFPRYSPHFLFQINITMIINMIYDYYPSGPDVRGAGNIAVLCKTCNLLLFVLEEPIVDNSSVGPISAVLNWEQLVQLA